MTSESSLLRASNNEPKFWPRSWPRSIVTEIFVIPPSSANAATPQTVMMHAAAVDFNQTRREGRAVFIVAIVLVAAIADS